MPKPSRNETAPGSFPSTMWANDLWYDFPVRMTFLLFSSSTRGWHGLTESVWGWCQSMALFFFSPHYYVSEVHYLLLCSVPLLCGCCYIVVSISGLAGNLLTLALDYLFLGSLIVFCVSGDWVEWNMWEGCKIGGILDYLGKQSSSCWKSWIRWLIYKQSSSWWLKFKSFQAVCLDGKVVFP